MRLNLTLSPNTDPVPFNHLHWLTGALHTWAGPDNALHDGPSLYSVGWLKGGHAEDGALAFPDGARWCLSFWEADAAKTVLDGILQDPSVCAGMRVVEAQQQTTPALSGGYRFDVDAPVIARRRRDDGSREYLLYDDERADAALGHLGTDPKLELVHGGDGTRGPLELAHLRVVAPWAQGPPQASYRCSP